jgi:hypothetical protein
MSAINLSRLRTQLELILPNLEDLEQFLKELREIYTFYADYTHPVGNPPSGVFTLEEFNTPVILNREVLLLLNPACKETPDHMLALGDRLWQEPQVEFRQLAAQILGKLPESKADAVLARIRDWSEASPNLELLPFLHRQASASIRRNFPEKWLDLLSEWDASAQPSLSRLAIEGVLPLIDDRDYENLPAIFTFLTPLFIQRGRSASMTCLPYLNIWHDDQKQRRCISCKKRSNYPAIQPSHASSDDRWRFLRLQIRNILKKYYEIMLNINLCRRLHHPAARNPVQGIDPLV